MYIEIRKNVLIDLTVGIEIIQIFKSGAQSGVYIIGLGTILFLESICCGIFWSIYRKN